MPRSGHRHQLVIYMHLINRWWHSIFAIGIVLIIIALGLYRLPVLAPWYPLTPVPANTPVVLGWVGGFAFLLAIFFIIIRKFAYVRAYENHLRLVTPFLQVKISYRRIRQTSTQDFASLFPPEKYRGRQREMLYPLMKRTVIVLDLNGFPLPRAALRLFFSRYFFPDKTPRLALLVPDWINFSTELESMRGVWNKSLKQPETDPNQAILDSISGRR